MKTRGKVLAFLILFSLIAAAVQNDSPADAIALEKGGKLTEAADAWRAFIRQHANDASAYASLGVVLSKQQRYAEAVDAYSKALRLNPKLSEIRMNLGLAEFKQGRFRAAIAPLNAALANDPSNVQARTLLGLSYYGDKQFANAAKHLKVATAAEPNNGELQHLLAQSCLWAGEYTCALDGFRQLLRSQPDSAAAHILVGEALDGLDKTSEAIAEFEKAAKVSPREPNVHFGLGFLYWKSHEYEKAKLAFETELRHDPDNAEALAYLGDTEMELGNREQATSLLTRAVALKSDVRIAHIDLGVLLLQDKRYKEAVSEFQKAIKLDPTQPDAHYRLAHAYQDLGQSVEAEKEFRLVQQLHAERDARLTPKMSSAPPALK
jgi:tetratricopeptide (TPR) repeat protein